MGRAPEDPEQTGWSRLVTEETVRSNPTVYRRRTGVPLETRLLEPDGEHAFQVMVGVNLEGKQRLGILDTVDFQHPLSRHFLEILVFGNSNHGHLIVSTRHRIDFGNPFHVHQCLCDLVDSTAFHVQQTNRRDHAQSPFSVGKSDTA